jgi:hypothetical protein
LIMLQGWARICRRLQLRASWTARTFAANATMRHRRTRRLLAGLEGTQAERTRGTDQNQEGTAAAPRWYTASAGTCTAASNCQRCIWSGCVTAVTARALDSGYLLSWKRQQFHYEGTYTETCTEPRTEPRTTSTLRLCALLVW